MINTTHRLGTNSRRSLFRAPIARWPPAAPGPCLSAGKGDYPHFRSSRLLHFAELPQELAPKPAATVLVAWELGGGLGHLVRMAPIVRGLRERGLRVALAVRDLARVERVFGELGVECYQAPVKTGRVAERVGTPRTMAHILHNSGFGEEDELHGLAIGWRNLLELLGAEVLLCDHSPTALLAARGTGIRVATLGTGFCCPPDLVPMPDLRPWLADASMEILRDEMGVLATANRVLSTLGGKGLGRLAQLFCDVDACFLATFPELDHYPQRGPAEYCGAWPNVGGAAPRWPGVGGRRVFAYLKPFAGIAGLLEKLGELGLPSLVYSEGISGDLCERFQSGSLELVRQRLDLEAVGRECDLAILNGGHGATASMLLAGKPILQIPLNLEQTLTAMATERLGAGVTASPEDPHQIASRLEGMLSGAERDRGAATFAERYRCFQPVGQIDRIVERIEAMVPTRIGRPRRTPAQFGGTRSRLIVGIGTGRCGSRSLAALLTRQPSTRVFHELRPILPWEKSDAVHDVRGRFLHLAKRNAEPARVGDVASSYLPYVEEILEAFDGVRVVCLRRGRQETVESYLRWLAQTRPGQRVDHWSADRTGLVDDPWDATFPKYPAEDTAEAIGKYWDEYYARAEQLARRYPDRVRLFETESVLNGRAELEDLLDWLEVPPQGRVMESIRLNGSRLSGT